MTATKGKVQGRQAELQLHKNPNAAFYFYKAKGKKWSGLIDLELFLIPKERGNNQEPAVSQRWAQPALLTPEQHLHILEEELWTIKGEFPSGWEMHPNQPVLWWTGVRLGWGVWSSQLGIPKLGGWFGTENSSHPGIPLWQAEIKARTVSGRLQEALGVPWVLREEGIPAFGRHCRDFPGLTLLPFRRAS